jgi:hypothetical protein
MAILDSLFGGSSQAELLGGLLGEDKLNQLRSQATQTGLINAAIGYLAQPKNQRFGSALPYLARAFTAGQQGAQGVYDDALRNYQTQAQLTEAKRKQDQQVKLQEMLAGIQDPQERLFASIAPDQYVAGKLRTRQAESPFAKIDPKDYTKESFKRYVQTGDISELEAVQKPTTDNMPSSVQEYNFARQQGFKGTFEDWKKLNKQEGVTVNYGAPMAALDAQGNPVFIQPSKTGGAPAVIPGFTPEGKPPTEAQAKSGAFGSQMQTASNEFERLQKEGFDPTSVGAQVSTALAGTPLTALADPKAQQANQAQQQWAEAYLRFKTGAAATEGEVIRNMRTFFPQIGDKPEVIAQKARMRKQAEQDVLSTAKQKPQAKQPAQTAPAGRSRADILKQYGL